MFEQERSDYIGECLMLEGYRPEFHPNPYGNTFGVGKEIIEEFRKYDRTSTMRREAIKEFLANYSRLPQLATQHLIELDLCLSICLHKSNDLSQKLEINKSELRDLVTVHRYNMLRRNFDVARGHEVSIMVWYIMREMFHSTISAKV